VKGVVASIHGARRGAGLWLGADHEALIRILQAIMKLATYFRLEDRLEDVSAEILKTIGSA
jgi:hypothetical protein